ncbi:LuxR C-terminal-related transcriptional regulator [Calothrix sp. NIES-3974]|uniref:LuxR C-terminal-related transcriptional regulator n=1 Tax=Calothrix sp. NIES-3974 TaxID=2005462 RepID=UPI000B60ADD5|nr:LuxR C-terminal-related transcriptional regulator [Calothrix sp. NIES-3974]BAZ05754.1 LuxR family GAF modulated transcriptional regulator [Calothrix sp. NIES-3974]
MANELQTVFQAIAQSQTEVELRQALTATIEGYFQVQRWGIYLFDEQPEVTLNSQGIPDVCLKDNPIGQFVFERHAPAHEALILPAGDWQLLCPRDDHAHVMSGPIVCDGRLIGTLNLARASGYPAFNTNDLTDLSALCLHLSAKLATLRSQPQKNSPSEFTNRLTPRELEIAELVAQGLTNAEIGEKLWITQNSVKQALKRMFRKLGVSARAEMVAKLRQGELGIS